MTVRVFVAIFMPRVKTCQKIIIGFIEECSRV